MYGDSPKTEQELATSRLIVATLSNVYRVRPDLSSRPDDVRAALELWEEAKGQRLTTFYHIIIHLPHASAPPVGVWPKGLLEVADVFQKQKWVRGGAWVLELEHKDGSIGYPHVHCLMESTKPRAHILRDLRKTWKDVIAPGQIAVLQVRSESHRQNIAEYLLKGQRNVLDTAYRGAHDIPTINFVGAMDPPTYEMYLAG